MGKLLNILPNAESRMIAHPSIPASGDTQVQQVEAASEPSESEHATVFQVMTESENHVGQGYFKARLRIAVWHRKHQDVRGDRERLLGATGTDRGLLDILESLVGAMHGSFLGDALVEPLFVVDHGQKSGGDDPGEFIRGDAVFRMGYISEAPFQATGDDGTGIDKGAA